LSEVLVTRGAGGEIAQRGLVATDQRLAVGEEEVIEVAPASP